MDKIFLGETGEIRIYTGNGFEDFLVGEFVTGNHIFSEVSTKIYRKINPLNSFRKVMRIEVWVDTVCVDFDSGESFEYYGLNYRHGGFYNKTA